MRKKVIFCRRNLEDDSQMSRMLKWRENQVGTFLVTTSPQLSEAHCTLPHCFPMVTDVLLLQFKSLVMLTYELYKEKTQKSLHPSLKRSYL